MEQKEMMDAALDLYAEWLSSWDGEPAQEFRKDLEKWSELLSVTDTGWYTIAIISANSGDDGGPAQLVVFFEPESLVDMKAVVSTMIQSFDTYTQTIYDTSLNENEGWTVLGEYRKEEPTDLQARKTR